MQWRQHATARQSELARALERIPRIAVKQAENLFFLHLSDEPPNQSLASEFDHRISPRAVAVGGLADSLAFRSVRVNADYEVL
jgi:hypothetical protein